jgi:hypothetical protein
MTIERLQLTQPIEPELLTRCAEYVNGWFGINHHQNLVNLVAPPEGVPELKIMMHNALHGRDYVSDEMVSAIGFKTIVSATQEVTEEFEEIISLVPRLVRSSRREKQSTLPNFAPGQFPRRAK